MLLSDLDTVPAITGSLIARPGSVRANDLTVLKVKLDAPWLSRSWYALEYDATRGIVLAYTPRGNEIGYISVAWLMALRGPSAERVTRDVAFTERPHRDVPPEGG